MLLALGVGSLFNHSRNPNLDYRIDHDQLVIKFFAAHDIVHDEELTIFYGNKLWFKDTTKALSADGLKGLSSDTTLHDHMDDEDAFLGQLTL